MIDYLCEVKKRILILSIITCVITSVQAQNPVPNPDFENWSGNDPAGWVCSNDSGFTITKSNDSHSGVFALRGFTNLSGSNWIVPFVSSDSTGFPMTQNFDYFNFWIKCQLDPPNALNVYVLLYDTMHQQIGDGFRSFQDTIIDTYHVCTVPLSYTGNVKYGYIRFEMMPAINFGSYFLIDELDFSNVSLAVPENVSSTDEMKLFPNPAHDKIYISGLKNGESTITLFNLYGERVMEKKSSGYTTMVELENLSPGIYSVRINSQENEFYRKLVVE